MDLKQRKDLEAPACPDEMLTIRQVLRLLGNVPESTFYRWRQLGKGPRAIKLPNGAVRIRRSEYDRWLGELEESA